MSIEEFKNKVMNISTFSICQIKDYFEEETIERLYNSTNGSEEDLRQAVESYMNIPSIYEQDFDTNTIVEFVKT